jgi:hypothetical protein
VVLKYVVFLLRGVALAIILQLQRPRFGLRVVHVQFVAYSITGPGFSPSSMVFPWPVIIPVVLILVCHEGLAQ